MLSTQVIHTNDCVNRRLLDALADPQLKLYRNGTPLWENDRWDSSQYSVLIAAARQSGAFPLPDIGSKDAAMLVTLAPGGYTAIVSAPTNTAGTALVEVYEVPPRS